jgi:hypothetical protein
MAIPVDAASTDWTEVAELLTSAYQQVAPPPSTA